ncbi:FecCD family ABC transporter permease [Selenomonas ruminantium]|uniref:Iron complex transport system permease protein n=1 Tax=Selenomonas ruminantium TaxID=971 RepID=A0A1H0UKP4_SELRU|nr:iron ABC transporter permease [Selenomonas ruminantium]SDP66446.1 iron complex transport system permease protein [Selenomonas ruminantium]
MDAAVCEYGSRTAHPRRGKRLWALGLGAVVLVLAILVSICQGAAVFTPGEVWQILLGGAADEHFNILYHIRLPRLITGALTGVNLALAGCILQGILRNPLADPGIIGVSAGAGLAAMVVLIIFPESTSLVPLVAFGGALLSVALVFSLSWENGVQPLRMVLAGVAVAAFFGGAMTALMVFYSDRVQGTVNWMAGGFAGRSWSHVQMVLPYTLLGLAGTFLGSRWLNALQMGEDTARSLGVRVERVRLYLLLLAALLAASAVSAAGMLGFVGLVIPHMVRLVTGSDFDYLLPASALWGAALVAGADVAARVVFAPIEIPVGVFMSFIGAPFFLYLLKQGLKRGH